MSTQLVDRRYTQFRQPRIASVLPEYFQEEYPQIITFLEKYYEFMDSDSTHSFDAIIAELVKSRDIRDTSLANLNYMLKEVGMGVIPTSYFQDPRYAATLLANFYRIKGSLYSAEGFFRAFYQSSVEITYPKRLLFTVGESLIGPDDGFIIQDGALYQIFSVLIRSEIPIAEWGDLYKMFVHPAGFYLGSEVTFTTVASMFESAQPIVVLDSDTNILTLTLSDTTSEITSFNEFSGIAIDPEGTTYRYSMVEQLEVYSNISIGALSEMYQSNEKLFSMNSHTFDEEDLRRNLLLRSEEFDNATWVKSATTVTANAGVAPDGTLTAEKIIPTAVDANHIASQSFATVTSGVSYTLSCYLKADGYGFARISFGTSFPSNWMFINLTTGAVGLNSGFTGITVEDAGDGWWRLSGTGVANATAGTQAVIYVLQANSFTTYTGDGVSGILVWGMQMEQAASASDYQMVRGASDVGRTMDFSNDIETFDAIPYPWVDSV